MEESFHDLKKRALANRLAQLFQEYSAAWAQQGQALNSPDELRIKRMIEELEVKIREAETQLKALDPEPVSEASQSTAAAPVSRTKGEPRARVAGVAGGLRYRNFDLRVRQIGYDRYSVETNSELAGQAEVEIGIQAFEEAVRAGERLEVNRIESLESGRRVGRLLYDAAFPPLIRERFALAQGRLAGGEGLRIRLQLDPLEVAGLPWELMYNPDPSAPGFVALSPALSLVRFLPTSRHAQPASKPPPLRLLMASAQPVDFALLDWEAEVALIREVLEPLQASIQVSVVSHLSVDGLVARISDDFDVLHFIGHGAFDRLKEMGIIVIEDDRQRGVALEAAMLAQLLEGSSVRFVFLNAAESTRASVTGKLGGLAQALVGAGVSTVVGLNGPVTDKSAARFAAEFYRGLAHGLPLDTCMLYGRRALYGRSALYGQDPGGFEWANVQLVTRAHDLNLLSDRNKDRS